MVGPRRDILHYRKVACVIWTIIALILGALGHWMGHLNIVNTFLVGVNYPDLRPLTEWLAKDDGLQILMILYPVGPILLWIIILFQVLAGSAMMKFIRNPGPLHLSSCSCLCSGSRPLQVSDLPI
jgi:hypothetical protein